MNWNRYLVCAFAIAAMAGMMGCPLAGPMIAGAWIISLDSQCDGEDVSDTVLLLYANGTAELLLQNDFEQGSWAIDGTTVTVTFQNLGSNGQDVVFTGTVDGALLVNGTTTSNGQDADLCWQASPIEV